MNYKYPYILHSKMTFFSALYRHTHTRWHRSTSPVSIASNSNSAPLVSPNLELLIGYLLDIIYTLLFKCIAQFFLLVFEIIALDNVHFSSLIGWYKQFNWVLFKIKYFLRWICQAFKLKATPWTLIILIDQKDKVIRSIFPLQIGGHIDIPITSIFLFNKIIIINNI